MWYVRECDKGGRVVMGVLRRRFCVDMIGGEGIYLFLVGYDACAGVSSLDKNHKTLMCSQECLL